jgi:protoporphyrinogen oxidase
MRHAVIIGGGPAGLAAAYEFTKQGASVTVLERAAKVGGLARTLHHDGCLFDIGPHRFYTKNEEVQQFYQDILAEDVLSVRRLTRILYNNRLFRYPLSPINVVTGLGIRECAEVLSAYGMSRLRHHFQPTPEITFEDWVSNRFGVRLYEIFFKTYTEKVWDIPCSELGADWAAQRIKGLSLPQAVRNAFFHTKGIKSLVDEFLFPRLGSGQFYEKLEAIITARGGTVRKNCRVQRVLWKNERVHSLVVENTNGTREVIPADFVLSSAPITEVIEMMDEPAPDPVLAASRQLRFRGHIGVHLKVEGNPFPDNWIYVHSKEVKMARLANYGNFSPLMAAKADVSPLTAEYFATENDGLWNSPDDALIGLAQRELIQTHLLESSSQVISGFVVRSPKAYAVMALGYEDNLLRVKSWLDGFSNLLPIGRSGMFKYNNQDHAIATGLLAARTALGLAKFDPWRVNTDAEYLEEVSGR